MTIPTPQDIENAATRASIAAKQNREFAEAQALAEAVLGKGARPWMKLSLIPSDHRQTGDCTPVATVFKVYKGELKLTENSVFIRRMPDGQVKTDTSYEPLFGELLDEKHATRTLELLHGKVVPAPRWEVAWSSLERYAPKSAEGLAAARAIRERKREEMADAAFQAEAPLFHAAGIRRKEVGPGGRG